MKDPETRDEIYRSTGACLLKFEQLIGLLEVVGQNYVFPEYDDHEFQGRQWSWIIKARSARQLAGCDLAALYPEEDPEHWRTIKGRLGKLKRGRFAEPDKDKQH